MSRKTAAIMLAIVMMITFTACNSAGKDEPAKEPKNKTEAEQVDLKEVYGAYQDTLAQNESAIRGYNWQNEAVDDYQLIERQVSLCDINNDDVPELFFFTGNNYQALMHIYSYIDGAAKELPYECSETATYFEGDTAPGFYDAMAASGTRYVIYRSTVENRFFIYHSIADETEFFRVNEFEIDKNGVIKEVNTLQNDYNHITHADNFWQNGNEITSDEFAVEFEKALSSIDEVIMYSGHDSTSIWRRFDTNEALSKSYDNMVGFFESELSELETK